MPDPWTDSAETEALLIKVRSGHREAFNELFNRHRQDLRRAVQLRMDRRLSARLDASDIVQEAQMEAYRRLDDYFERQPMPFALWLRKTAQERIHDHRRAHLHTTRRSIQFEEGLPDRSSMLLAAPFLQRGSSPSRRLAQREYANLVAQAVSNLEELDREILLMRNVEDLSHQQIAEVLDLSHDAVRKRYGRAIIKLQRLLVECGLSEFN